MPLIGINPVSESQRKPTTMETIATGIDAAAKILGVGTDVYSKTFGPDAKLKAAQTEQAQAEAGYTRMRPELENQKMIKEAQGKILSMGYEFATDRDADPTKRPLYIPELGTSVNVKFGPKLKQEMAKEQSAMADAAAKDFGGLDEVQRQKVREEAARDFVSLAQSKPSKSNDLALIQQFIRFQSPNARFNGENVENVDAAVSDTFGNVIKTFKKIYTSEGGKLDDNERQALVNTVANQYSATRPIYDNRWKEYEAKARERGIKTYGYEKPVDFGPVLQKQKPTPEEIQKFLKGK